jgi:hypothetical protein
MAYLLDADVFIRAKNLHYGFDFCPAFWEWLVAHNAAGKLFSVEKVGDEIRAIEDELSEWAGKLDSGFFLRPDAEVLASMAGVSAWAQAQHYEASAISTFLPRSIEKSPSGPRELGLAYPGSNPPSGRPNNRMRIRA